MSYFYRVNNAQVIQEKERQIKHLAETNAQLNTKNLALNTKVAELEAELAWFRRMVFGQKRERFIPSDPSQLEMALGVETDQSVEPESEPEPEGGAGVASH